MRPRRFDKLSPSRRPALRRALADAVLDSPGDTPSTLRRAVEAHAAAVGAVTRTPAEIPGVIEAYVDKVARHAYRTTEEDIAGLRAAGYSEDAIFELTLSAALGAGMARLERGLEVLARCRTASQEASPDLADPGPRAPDPDRQEPAAPVTLTPRGPGRGQ